MTDDISITLVQASPSWEDIEGNLIYYRDLVKKTEQLGDIVVLPELFTTGFTMNTVKLFERMDGRTMIWMSEISGEINAVLIGSLIVREGNNYFNRLIWMKPDGEYTFYNKRHLFRMGEENKNYTPGQRRITINHGGWQICPLICYDLRFPVWSRNRNDYDILIYIANWPESRRDVWKCLLKARAIENQCYVFGVNRIGEDGMGIRYAGDTMAVDFKGNIICEFPYGKEGTETIPLNKNALDQFKNKFPAHLDADKFEIKS